MWDYFEFQGKRKKSENPSATLATWPNISKMPVSKFSISHSTQMGEQRNEKTLSNLWLELKEKNPMKEKKKAKLKVVSKDLREHTVKLKDKVRRTWFLFHVVVVFCARRFLLFLLLFSSSIFLSTLSIVVTCTQPPKHIHSVFDLYII